MEYSIMRHRLSSLWINALNTSSFITLLIRIEKKFFKVGNENHLSILSTVGSISKGNLNPINILSHHPNSKPLVNHRNLLNNF